MDDVTMFDSMLYDGFNEAFSVRGPSSRHLSESEQASFDATCRKLLTFLNPPDSS
jgi:hypothetical protein